MGTRRDFLKYSACYLGACAASIGFSVNGFASQKSQVYVSESKNIKMAVQHAIEMAGGMSNFVKPEDIVAIKPNMAWARAPEYAANTNPYVVEEVVRLCFKAGAREVYVTDNPCNNARSVYSISKIPQHAISAGAKVFIPQKRHYKKMLINGEFVKQWDVLELFKKADKIINVPVAKHHGSAEVTCSMKNWFGAIGGFRGFLHRELHQAIFDLANFFKPQLNIVDCSRVLIKNGPTGGSLDHVKILNKIIVSKDQAAADSVTCKLLGFDPFKIEYLIIAHKKGLGNITDSQIQIYYEKI